MWVSVVLNSTTKLFWRSQRFFYWLLRSCAGQGVKIVPNTTESKSWHDKVNPVFSLTALAGR